MTIANVSTLLPTTMTGVPDVGTPVSSNSVASSSIIYKVFLTQAMAVLSSTAIGVIEHKTSLGVINNLLLSPPNLYKSFLQFDLTKQSLVTMVDINNGTSPSAENGGNKFTQYWG